MRARGLWAGVLASAALVSACSGDAPRSGPTPRAATPASTSPSPAAPSPSKPTETPGSPVVAGTVATGLQTPWGMGFLPDGDALVTERDTGRVLRVSPSGGVSEVGTVPDVGGSGEGGLLGLAVSPHFAQDRAVFLYVTTDRDNRIVRHTLGSDGLRQDAVLVTGIPASPIHNGGRLAFGPDGNLYAGTGDASDGARAQDRGSLGGKILRLTPEGDAPADNPFDGSLVYSYGHRNVQGLAFDEQGRLWASEFGQNRFDELNLISPGANYGWPEVEGLGGGSRFTDPVAVWPTDEASPSGVAFLDGAIYMAALRGERLWQIPLDRSRAAHPRDFLVGAYGRLRTVTRAPDGSLWLTTSNRDGRGRPRDGDDRILRVVPR